MFDDFTDSINPYWSQTCLGTGTLQSATSALRMSIPSAKMGAYSDAQIDDYAGHTRRNFPWQPPLYMEVRARSSHPAATTQSTVESSNILRGTAGFGFWNYPFSVRGDILMLPEAIWFFYASPPSNMALVPDVPGWGWKAQVVHSMRAESLAATAPMALSAAWARLTGETGPAAHWMQRLSGASEAILNIAMDEWHTYRIEWQHDKATFWVDGLLVHTVLHPPTRPLGFVAWLDNQFAVATPRGVLRFGTVASGPQWFELDSVMIVHG
ncbi:MAG TPA: family 16 glycosylhydrolase [Ktedonobacteraceae bacterium]|nr:family 16 glycosylhydrolase [Ktedonobacteraceae bacterium]